MKTWAKVLARTGLGLAALLVGAAVGSLDLVDHRPYFNEPYYAETVARLAAESAAPALVRGELAAGFGRARLTPQVNAPQDDAAKGEFRQLPLAGYGSRRGRSATGAHDELYIKAVALRVGARVGVLIGADALIIPAEVTEAVLQRLGDELQLSREQVYLSATHTHAGPGGWGEGLVAEAFAGGFQPGARVWFATCIVAAVREAMADLRPAEFGRGSVAAPAFVRNRLVGTLGRVDPEFSFAVVKQKSGRLAVLGSYSAHATVLPASVMEFSADYPGVWQREIEQATGGVAVFLAGGVGSHGPVAGDKGFSGVERMGRALARAVLEEVPRTALANVVTLGAQGVVVTMPPLNIRITDGIRLRPWLARQLYPVRPSSFLQAFRVGDTVWLSAPCDFSGELALDLKDALRPRGLRAIVTSFNGDYVGYVICPRYYHLDGYEPRVMSFFGPNVPDYFGEVMRTLAGGLADQ